MSKFIQMRSKLSGTENSSPILKCIPDNYEGVKFTELKPGLSYKNKYIVGKIRFLTKMRPQQKKCNFRKCFLSDTLTDENETPESQLSVFLFNDFANRSSAAEVEGLLAISNFQVESLTLGSSSINGVTVLPVQVLVKDDTGDNGTAIWIARKMLQPQIANINHNEMVKKQGLSQQTNEKRLLNIQFQGSLQQRKNKQVTTPTAKEKRKNCIPVSESTSSTPTKKKKNARSVEQHDENNRQETFSKQETLQQTLDRKNKTAAKQMASQQERSKKHKAVSKQWASQPARDSREEVGPPTCCYTYTALGELHESSSQKETFNVYGIVEDCHVKVKQGHRVQTLDLVLCDRTKSDFQVCVFSMNDENFPDVHPGDVVRVHRMMVECLRGKLKGKCYSPKFIVVFSHEDKGEDPKSVANQYTFTSGDIAKVAELFYWDENRKWRLISEVEVGEYVNILCQVVSVYNHRLSDSVLVTFWDGTKNDEIDFEYQNTPSAVVDKELLRIAQDYLVHMWVNGNYAVAAAELKPTQFIEVLDVILKYPKGNSPSGASFCLRPPFKENRGINIIDEDSIKLTELKSRLKRITDEFYQNCDRLSETSVEDLNPLNTNISAIQQNLSQQRDQSQKKKQIPTSGINAKFGSTVRSSQTSKENESYREVFHERQLKDRSRVTENLLEPNDAPVHKAQTQPVARQGVTNTFQKTSSQQPAVRNEMHSAKSVQQQPEHTPHGSQRPDATQVLSVINAGILPGQSTQTFGRTQHSGYETTQRTTQSRTITQRTQDTFAASRNQPYPYSSAGGQLSQLSQFQIQERWWENIQAISASVGHPNIKPSTLPEVLAHSVPYKFRIFAVVLTFQPDTQQIGDLIRLYCPKCHFLSSDSYPTIENQGYRNGVALYNCPKCCSGSSRFRKNSSVELQYTYLLSFIMHDGSGSEVIDVCIWQDNAVKFFKGISPEEALSDASQADLIFQRLWEVCPNSRPYNGGSSTINMSNGMRYPTLDCCIMSYTAGGVTRYQMFDTVLTS